MWRRTLPVGDPRAHLTTPGLAVTLSAVVALLGAARVNTARAADAAEAEADDTVRLQEVTVTAQLRQQNQQEVPVSVTAINAATLEQFHAVDLDGLSLSTPGFAITRTQGSLNGASIYIRGIGNDSATAANEPGVGLYVDDVYLGQNIGAMLDFVDVDSVEILRGPQGTLYGRNTIGGAVKVLTNKPRIGELDASGDLSFGSFNQLNVRGVINVPLNDQMAMSVSGVSLTNNGWYKHAISGVDLNRQDRKGLKLAYLWNIASNLKLFATADYNRDRSGLYVATPMTSQNPATTQPRYGSYFLSDPTVQDKNRFDGGGYMARLSWDTGIGNLDVISSLRSFSFYQSYDLSYTPQGTKFAKPMTDHQLTEELRFTSGWSGPFSMTAGLYYYKDHSDELRTLTAPVSIPTFRLNIENNQTSQSYAAYAQLSYAITSALTLTVGGRETHDTKTMVHTGDYVVTGKSSNSEFSPMGTVSYKITPDAFAYVTGSGGYTAGVYQGFPSSLAASVFVTPPQFVTATEAGLKTEWMDHKLMVNMAAFNNKYTNLPVTVNGSGNLIQVVTTRLKAYGGELELAYKPVKALTLSGYVSRLKTEFVANVPGVASAPKYGDIQRYSPPWSSRLTADYNVPLYTDHELGINGNWVWSDTNQTTGVPNNPFFTLPPLNLLNAGITFRDTKNDWSVQVGGKNLTNALWWDQASVSSGAVRYYQPRRTWFVMFTYGR